MTFLHINSHVEVPIHSVSSIFEILSDAIIDTLKVLPFLFVAFLVIEFLEHRAQDSIKNIFSRVGSAGPLVGTLLGCIPQCGFSVMCANLYSSGIIALGPLVAVFLSTSDEAIILLATAHNGGYEIFKLLITKIIIETLEKEVEVEAEDRDEAEQIVSDAWHNSEYILDAEDFKGVTFKAEPPARKRESYER